MDKTVSFHVDIDSPLKELEFWGIPDAKYTTGDLDKFYETAMNRALRLFRQYNIPVTFFCVGEELQKSEGARESIKRAHKEGHEIANHTYSHPFGLTKLDKPVMRKEIELCSKVIKKITGTSPAGFRAPGYDMNTCIVNELESLSFRYDSSAFWTILKPVIKAYHKMFGKNKEIHSGFGENSARVSHSPYFPSRHEWLTKAKTRKIVEIPLPRTKFLNLPFYNNFHIITGNFYRRLALKNFNRPYFIYLFHLIEFVDFNDGIPKQLVAKPGLKLSSSRKIGIIRHTIETVMRRYKVMRTDDFVKKFNGSLL